jgi:hypothetical protein
MDILGNPAVLKLEGNITDYIEDYIMDYITDYITDFIFYNYFQAEYFRPITNHSNPLGCP